MEEVTFACVTDMFVQCNIPFVDYITSRIDL